MCPSGIRIFAVWAVMVAVLAGCGGAGKRSPAPRAWVAVPGGGAVVDPGDALGACHGPDVIAGSQVEPYLAVSPTDPALIAGAWQQDRISTGEALGISVASSRDSGRNWSTSQLPYVTGCGGGGYRSVSDPQVGIGPDGRIYVSTIALGPPGQAVLVSSSADSGRSWSHPAVVRRVADGAAILDKPALLVDRYRPATAYEVWVEYPRPPGASLSALRVDSAFISTTRNGGRTWSDPVRLYGADTENQNHVPLELADGTLIDVFAEAYRLSPPATTEQVRAVRSTDGGRSWSAPVTAAQFPFSAVTSGSNAHPVRASGQDVSASARGNSVYVSWEYNTPGRTQLGVVRSFDGGRTWARTADPVSGRVVAFLPQIAVDAHGDVGLTWYQAGASTGDPTTVEFDELDPGSTQWTPDPVMGPFSLDRAAPSPDGYFLGDYQGLIPTPCGFRLFDSIVTTGGPRIATTEMCRRPSQLPKH